MNQWTGRLDYQINSSNMVFFRYGQNPFSEFRGLVFIRDVNEDNPAEPTGNAPLIRNGRNWTFNWTSTLSPRLTFNLRAGLNRWEETTGSTYRKRLRSRTAWNRPRAIAAVHESWFPRLRLYRDVSGHGAKQADQLRR